MTLIVSRDSVNYGSEKIVAEVMSDCEFESIHSCYVRRLRVVLRNVSAVLVITLNISCSLKYIFFQQDQIVVAEWLIFSFILL